MRIVHFDQMFHPEFGYQINILPKFQVMQGHEVYIVTGKADVPHPNFVDFADNEDMDNKDRLFEEQTGVRIVRIDIKRFISGRAIYKRGYRKIVDDLKPDVLFCHFNDTVVGIHYTLISNRLDYPVVFDSHMLEMASRNRFSKLFHRWYRTFIAPLIVRRGLIVVRTQDDPYVEKCLGIPLEQAPFISFGTDTSLFYPDERVRAEFRRSLGISENDFVIVYTGKLDESKGGLFLAEGVKERLNSQFHRNVVVLVVGNSPDSEYGNLVEDTFRRSENRVIRFPTQKYTELPRFYQVADLAVFPKQCSLSFYDAQACGLPVILEDNSVNIKRSNHGNGFVFESANIEDFRRVLFEAVNLEESRLQEMRKNAISYIKDNYDYWNIALQYNEVVEKAVKEFEK